MEPLKAAAELTRRAVDHVLWWLHWHTSSRPSNASREAAEPRSEPVAEESAA